MFFKKRQITEIEKTETILDYLNAQLNQSCHDTNTSTQDYVSNVINHLQTEINYHSEKLNKLRNITSK